MRSRQLDEHPLCAWCEREGRVTVATVVHHVVPHKGDWDRFLDGPFLSLCKDHHDDEAKEIEYRGYHGAVDVNGYPIDPNHPSNRKN